MAKIPAAVGQDFHGSDGESVFQVLEEVLIHRRAAAQNFLVDERLSAGKVNLAHTISGSFLQVQLQFIRPDLLKTAVYRGGRRIAVLAAKIAERALHHPQVFQHQAPFDCERIDKTPRLPTAAHQCQTLGMHSVAV